MCLFTWPPSSKLSLQEQQTTRAQHIPLLCCATYTLMHTHNVLVTSIPIGVATITSSTYLYAHLPTQPHFVQHSAQPSHLYRCANLPLSVQHVAASLRHHRHHPYAL
jgi:hypothetical protein